MTLCRCVRKPPLPARSRTVERAIRPAARSALVFPKGCFFSSNAVRRPSVAHTCIGLSGERTHVTVVVDLASATTCTPCIERGSKMLKEIDPALRLPVCLIKLVLVVDAYLLNDAVYVGKAVL